MKIPHHYVSGMALKASPALGNPVPGTARAPFYELQTFDSAREASTYDSAKPASGDSSFLLIENKYKQMQGHKKQSGHVSG